MNISVKFSTSCRVVWKIIVLLNCSVYPSFILFVLKSTSRRSVVELVHRIGTELSRKSIDRYSCNIFKLSCIFSRFTRHRNWMTVIADISVTSDISSWKFKNGFCWRSGLVSILNTTRTKSTPNGCISLNPEVKSNA